MEAGQAFFCRSFWIAGILTSSGFNRICGYRSSILSEFGSIGRFSFVRVLPGCVAILYVCYPSNPLSRKGPWHQIPLQFLVNRTPFVRRGCEEGERSSSRPRIYRRFVEAVRFGASRRESEGGGRRPGTASGTPPEREASRGGRRRSFVRVRSVVRESTFFFSRSNRRCQPGNDDDEGYPIRGGNASERIRDISRYDKPFTPEVVGSVRWLANRRRCHRRCRPSSRDERVSFFCSIDR